MGEPDADLEVAGVGGVVAEQHESVRRAGGLVVTDHLRDLVGDVGGPSATGSASTSTAAVQPTPSAERSCSTASADPIESTVA